MSVELGDYVESLRREVTPLGTALPTTITVRELTAYLSDAFWEARLDGFCKGYTADEDGIIDPIDADGAINPDGADISRALIALVIIYAGVRILRNKVLNTQSTTRAKAGPVEYETQNSSTMLAEMLKQLAATKAALRAQATADPELHHVYGFDAFSERLFSAESYYGSPRLAIGG